MWWLKCTNHPLVLHDETYCFCPVRLSVTQFVSATPLKLLNRISWNLVDSKDTICSCAYYQEILIYYLPSFMKFCSAVSEELHWQAASVVNFGKFLSSKVHNSHKIVHITRKFWSPEFCGSYAPLNWEISQNLLLKQLVSATPLKLLKSSKGHNSHKI
jgi:hypothetical protein